jgi:hypothetical protein
MYILCIYLQLIALLYLSPLQNMQLRWPKVYIFIIIYYVCLKVYIYWWLYKFCEYDKMVRIFTFINMNIHNSKHLHLDIYICAYTSVYIYIYTRNMQLLVFTFITFPLIFNIRKGLEADMRGHLGRYEIQVYICIYLCVLYTYLYL